MRRSTQAVTKLKNQNKTNNKHFQGIHSYMSIVTYSLSKEVTWGQLIKFLVICLKVSLSENLFICNVTYKECSFVNQWQLNGCHMMQAETNASADLQQIFRSSLRQNQGQKQARGQTTGKQRNIVESRIKNNKQINKTVSKIIQDINTQMKNLVSSGKTC